MKKRYSKYTFGKLKNTGFTAVFLSAMSLVLVSCEKDGAASLTFRTGDIVTINRSVDENFTRIYLNDNVNLILTQSPTYSIRLEGGENILGGIKTDIADNTLTIRNTNTFNWLRSYDKEITAYVTMPHLLILDYEATSKVYSTDTICEDSLAVTARGGSGYINLIIRTGTSKLSITSGSADMNISGKTGVNFIFSGGYGPFHCFDLQSDYLFMRNASTNHCSVNVKHEFEYEITSLGNIYYKGNPSRVSGSITGEGQLIKSD
jgi:hypothetical protein